MRVLFQDELTTKVLFGRIKREIQDVQLEKMIDDINCLNEARKNVITKCDIALKSNKNNGY